MTFRTLNNQNIKYLKCTLKAINKCHKLFSNVFPFFKNIFEQNIEKYQWLFNTKVYDYNLTH